MPSDRAAEDPGEKLFRAGARTNGDPLLDSYSSSAGLCILDLEHRYIWINRQLAEMNGVPAPEHIGKTVREVLGGLSDAIEPLLERVYATGEPILNSGLAAAHPATKTAVHWTQHFFPLKDSSGKVTRIGVVVTETPARELHKLVRDLDGKLRKEMARVQVFNDVRGLLSSNWDVPLVFPMLSARIRRLLHHELASFVLYDAATHELIRQSIDFPLSKGVILNSPLTAKNSPAERALKACASIIFSKKELQELDAEIARSLLEEGLQSLCCIPMIRPSGPLGVLVLGSTRTNAFQTEDLDLLNQVAFQLALAMENHRAACEIESLKQRLSEERKYLQGETRFEAPFHEIVGKSAALKQVLDQVATVAVSGATVLILGETGTGKELIARAIHRLSRRKEGAFIKVNCAAIPTGLLESELFGHEKGAFTGAISQKIGRLELAHGGTLFLDEVGEIPVDLQPKLLRVLQDYEFERLGSTRTIKVDLRLIAATNRNLSKSIARHEFRSDLYYRLSVFPIVLPPLRERREDIPLLVRHFVKHFSRRMERYVESVPRKTMDVLENWTWPGNVRELENLMERSVILSESRVLRVPLSELHAASPAQPNHADQTLDGAERQHIILVLRETKGVLSGPAGAARRLGLKRTTLQSKMERLKITRHDYSDLAES